MTSQEVSAINVGRALRDGVQLKTVEVVALLHNGCSQIDAGKAAALPQCIDDLWVTDAGTVVLPRIAPAEPTRSAVASLLATLLPKSEAAVPAALRTLPARLLESGTGAGNSDIKDLLTILRWHLPADSSVVLRDLVTRVQLSRAEPEPAAAMELLPDEGETALPAAAPAAAPHARSSYFRRRSLAIAASLLVAIGMGGYAGYRFAPSGADAPARIESEAAVPAPGRITRADAAPPAPAAATTSAAIAPALRSSNARPLDLPVAGGAFSPSFASTGGTLLFHAGRNSAGRLFQASLDPRGRASATTPVFEAHGRTYHARPSPDGEWVAFDSDRDGERGVYVASRDGARVARVSGEGYAAVPSWSPDMKLLAFVRGEPGRPKVWNLWLRDIATGALVRESSFKFGQVWGASWFPNGRSLSYSHEDRLFIAEADSGAARSFASPIKGRLIRTPAVSPDGTRIVFQVYRDGAWLLDIKSGAMRRILADPSAEEFAWDPRGTQIAYHSRRDGQWRIWLLPI
jgi:hypothetical protein